MNMFSGMFGPVAPGMCRLAMNGGIAVKTSSGYKTYNIKKKRLTNCDNFAFDVGGDFFFVIPTNKVVPGDIILISGKPKCVVSVDEGSIRVVNYEDSTVENILPEHHMFMGNMFFYGKIASPFGNVKTPKGFKNAMKFQMMSSMMNGSQNNSYSGSQPQNGMMNFPMMLMMGGGDMFDGMFDGMFDTDMDDTSNDVDVNASNENEDEEED